MLCKICVGVLETRDTTVIDHQLDSDTPPELSFVHHRTPASLIESAGQLCHICREIWDQLPSADRRFISKWEQGEDEKSWQTKYPISKQPEEDGIVPYLTKAKLLFRADSDCYCLAIRFNPDFPFLHDVHFGPPLGAYILEPIASNKRLSRGTLQSHRKESDRPWGHATTWIHACLTSHPRCNKLSKAQWYPTRLLDVQVKEKNNDSIRLVCTTHHQISGPYVTLSHCWGKTRLIQLLRSNLKEFQAGIPIADLPATFKDAVSFARRLGVRYIWIDALCIIQDKDDLSDWNTEAGKMDRVYSDSYCNISALDAENSTEGLFLSQNSAFPHPAEVNVCVRGFPGTQDYVRCVVWDIFFWTHQIQRRPVNRRGWVFQERLLSPRVLYFGQHQLFWECCELRAAASFPSGLPELLNFQSHNLKDLYSNTTRNQPNARWHDVWNGIVRFYTGTLLTVASDKLVALSGIAKQVQAARKDDYIAGLWRKDLEIQLLWHASRHVDINGSPCRSPTYRAPTWSWASVEGNIYPGGAIIGIRKSLLAVKDVHLEYATQDLTGAVTAGYLDLKGSLKPYCLKRYPHWQASTSTQPFWECPGNRLYVAWIGFTTSLLRIDCDDGAQWQDFAASMCPRSDCDSFCFQEMPCCLDHPLDDDEMEVERGSFYCTPGGARTQDTQLGLVILLLRAVDLEEGLFERIGLAYCGFSNNLDALLAQPEDWAPLPLGPDSEGMYTIRVI